MPIVLPPTATVKQIADALDHAVHEFLVAAKSTNITGKYESEVEAWKLFTLAMRDVEAVAELARIDLVLLPAASVLARAVFEIAVKACWMVQPDDPFQKEVRWLAHLQEEERMQERLANKATHFGANPDPFIKNSSLLREFRTGVVGVLPHGYSELPGNPSVETMLQDLGEKQMYTVYVSLSAFVHGSHAATWLYRRGLGVSKEHGEFIRPNSWQLPLWTTWTTFLVLGGYLLGHLGARVSRFMTRERIENTGTALSELANETNPAASESSDRIQ